MFNVSTEVKPGKAKVTANMTLAWCEASAWAWAALRHIVHSRNLPRGCPATWTVHGKYMRSTHQAPLTLRSTSHCACASDLDAWRRGVARRTHRHKLNNRSLTQGSCRDPLPAHPNLAPYIRGYTNEVLMLQ